MMRPLPIAAVVFALIAGPAHASDHELQGYEDMLGAIEMCSPDMKLVMFAAGMAYMAKHELPDAGTCGDAWDALSRAPMETRATLVAAAMEGCPAMQCGVRPKRLDRVWNEADPARRAAALVQACDAAGPEPVFVGDLVDQRAQMDLLEYLAYRAAFVTAYGRLDEIGGDRAVQAKARFEALVPTMARDLVRHRAPMVDGLELPITTSVRRPEAGAYPTVWVTADTIAVDGRVVCSVADASRDGALIVPLYDVLVEQRDSLEALTRLGRGAIQGIPRHPAAAGGPGRALPPAARGDRDRGPGAVRGGAAGRIPAAAGAAVRGRGAHARGHGHGPGLRRSG